MHPLHITRRKATTPQVAGFTKIIAHHSQGTLPMPAKAIFNKEELLQIALLCRIGCESVSVVDDKILLNIWRKIEPTLSSEEKQDIELALQNHLRRLQDGNYNQNYAEIRALIQTALQDNKKLRLRYYAHTTGQTTERVVQPITLEQRGDSEYLVAFCELRQEERNFRLDAIQEIELLPARHKKKR